MFAIVHAAIAMGLAFLLWQPAHLHYFFADLSFIWQQNTFPEFKALALVVTSVQLAAAVAGPPAYLWAVRCHNLHASASREVVALEADLQAILAAAATLKKVSAEAPGIRSQDEQSGHEPGRPAAYLLPLPAEISEDRSLQTIAPLKATNMRRMEISPSASDPASQDQLL